MVNTSISTPVEILNRTFVEESDRSSIASVWAVFASLILICAMEGKWGGVAAFTLVVVLVLGPVSDSFFEKAERALRKLLRHITITVELQYC